MKVVAVLTHEHLLGASKKPIHVVVQTEVDSSWDALDAVIEELCRSYEMRPKDVLVDFTLINMTVIGEAA